MPDFERSAEIGASPDALFDYLADVAHLPEYFPKMTEAHPVGPEEVEVTANVGPQTRHAEAWFDVDREAHRLAWGSEEDTTYHGWLDVDGRGDRSTVTLHLHTEHGGDADRDLQQALDNIKRLVEAPT
jgi:uncharacterized protein YndB with AHSA1/START domain